MIQEMKNNALTKAKSRKGFTLAELLIVVAIIAILIAIAIPLFTKQMDSAKKATDDANFRTAKALAMGCEVDMIDGGDPKDSKPDGTTVTLTDGAHEFSAEEGNFSGTKKYDGQSAANKGKKIIVTIDKTAKSAKVSWK